MSGKVKAWLVEPELLQLCVHVGAIRQRVKRPDLPQPSQWWSDSITLLRETGHQTWVCKGEQEFGC